MRYATDHFMYAAGNDFRNTIRTGLEMSEPVDEALLRQAVDRLPLRFPYYAVRLIREGESYYYEPNEESYVIARDGKAVVLGSEESNGHLVAFAYRGNYLYIDSSHFLMDGGGQFPFLKMLLYEYLSRKYPEAEFDTSDIPQPGDIVRPEEMMDYFDVNIMQRNSDGRYVDNILAQLEKLGIHSEAEAPESFEICGFQPQV